MIVNKIDSFFKFLGHPFTIGVIFGVIKEMYPPGSMEHLQYYIAACTFMAAGLARK